MYPRDVECQSSYHCHFYIFQELKSNRAQAGACPTLLRSLAAWSLWTAAFGLFFGIALVTIYMPSILSCQEIFLVDYLGVYSVLPFILVVSSVLFVDAL
ncbi:hypothetical protein Y032_0582g285 [Ancylostoma ceylanicum]|nr:hypothetical protein Y032_0582g285 [Ancylostoma ceylanicum]